jgi:hypothetical protein
LRSARTTSCASATEQPTRLQINLLTGRENARPCSCWNARLPPDGGGCQRRRRACAFSQTGHPRTADCPDREQACRKNQQKPPSV